MELAQTILAAGLLAATAVLTYATWRYAVAAERQAQASTAQARATENQAEASRSQVEGLERQTATMGPRPYVYLKLERVGAALVLTNGGERVAHHVRVTVEEESTPVGGDSQWLSGSKLVASESPAIPPGGAVRESRDLSLLVRSSRGDVVRFRLDYLDGEGRQFAETVTYSLGEVGGSADLLLRESLLVISKPLDATANSWRLCETWQSPFAGSPSRTDRPRKRPHHRPLHRQRVRTPLDHHVHVNPSNNRRCIPRAASTAQLRCASDSTGDPANTSTQTRSSPRFLGVFASWCF
jgi:hypothetical protein